MQCDLSETEAFDLLQKAGLLSAVVNALPFVAYAFDPDGTILMAEGQALAGLRSAPGVVVGRSVLEVFAGETETLRHIRRAMAGEAHEADITLALNGRSYHVWYTPSFDADGKLAMVAGLLLDTTEREQSDRELREATRWLQDMLDRLPVAIYRVNAEGVLTYARGSFLPERTQQWVGKPLADSIPHFPELVRAVEEAQAGRDQAFSASGGGRHFEFLVNGMRHERGSDGVIGIAIEVTESRRAADAIEESEQKSRFLAAISHEIRTPLNSVLGFSELLLRDDFGPLTDRQHRYVSNIRSSGQHLLDLINEILDLSKAEAGHLSVGSQAVITTPIVTEVVEQMAPVAQARRVQLAIGRQSQAPVSADPRRLSQILRNLVSNALKFTPAGGEVTVSSYRRFGVLTLKVVDNGVGISSRHLDRIFEEFFQVPGADLAGIQATGTGLGLALSRRLARSMGGDLTVRSSVGRGSTFLLSLPLHRPS